MRPRPCLAATRRTPPGCPGNPARNLRHPRKPRSALVMATLLALSLVTAPASAALAAPATCMNGQKDSRGRSSVDSGEIAWEDESAFDDARRHAHRVWSQRGLDRVRFPADDAGRIGHVLHIHAVPLVFAQVEGPVGGDAVDRQKGPIQDQLRLHQRGPHCFGERGGEGGQESTASVMYGCRSRNRTRAGLGLAGGDVHGGDGGDRAMAAVPTGPWSPESAGTTDSRTMALEALVAARPRSHVRLRACPFISAPSRLSDICQRKR